ncbi:hypothetical protein YC2023_010380 [Brassica napus]
MSINAFSTNRFGISFFLWTYSWIFLPRDRADVSPQAGNTLVIETESGSIPSASIIREYNSKASTGIAFFIYTPIITFHETKLFFPIFKNISLTYITLSLVVLVTAGNRLAIVPASWLIFTDSISLQTSKASSNIWFCA